MQLTKEQESSILIAHQEAIAAAIKTAVDNELKSIKSDWKMQNQVQELLRTQFGCMINEVIAEKLNDRKLVEELVSEKLAASIKNRLTRQLQALENPEP